MADLIGAVRLPEAQCTTALEQKSWSTSCSCKSGVREPRLPARVGRSCRGRAGRGWRTALDQPLLRRASGNGSRDACANLERLRACLYVEAGPLDAWRALDLLAQALDRLPQAELVIRRSLLAQDLADSLRPARLINWVSSNRVGGHFKYSMMCGSIPELRIIAGTFRDVPHS